MMQVEKPAEKINQQVVELINEKQVLQKYRRLRTEIIRKGKRDKGVLFNEIYDEINSTLWTNSLDKAYDKVKKFLGK